MTDYNELEITLEATDSPNNGDRGAYKVWLKLVKGEAALSTPLEVGPATISLDFDSLRAHLLENQFETYGEALRDSVFEPPEIHTLLVQAMALTPLRIRLRLDPADPQLHSLRWEMLTGPDGVVLSSKEGLAISRYLPSGREVTLRREPDELRALIVVVDPAEEDRAKYGLAEIDVDFERRETNLSPIPCDSLTSDDGPVTMNRLIAKLKAGVEKYGGYDILYLVCHGAMVRGTPHLLLALETEEEQANRFHFRSGEVLVQRLAEEVPSLPRLVVLASCASAGTESDDALTAFGPLLATLGTPAVIAMQGFVNINTVEALLPVFFSSLIENGEVDRAMRDARNHVKNERNDADWWMPVLFMRLATGRIWYTPGFDVKNVDEDNLWSQVTSSISLQIGFDSDLPRSYCTPILGPTLEQHMFGSARALANQWAREHAFPLAPYDREQLPRVMQYLKVQRFKEANARVQYRNQLDQELRRRYPAVLAESSKRLDIMIADLWEQELKDDPTEPHNILATLPFTCYITTSPVNALEVALRHQGRNPHVAVYDWRGSRMGTVSGADEHVPSFEEPLIFHLFGHIKVRNSLVLFEDDYFEYMISFVRNWPNRVPSGVVQALTDAALLFLGFRLHRWDFRITFRSLLSQANGSGMLNDYPHVAAQLSSEESSFIDAQAAHSYLVQYFKGANPDKINLDIYWGEASDFLLKLSEKWAEYAAAEGG